MKIKVTRKRNQINDKENIDFRKHSLNNTIVLLLDRNMKIQMKKMFL